MEVKDKTMDEFTIFELNAIIAMAEMGIEEGAPKWLSYRDADEIIGKLQQFRESMIKKGMI